MIDLQSVLGRLAKARPIFHSEADFQHALAWVIHSEVENVGIRLEVPIPTSLGVLHVDVVARYGDDVEVLELKYKTKRVETAMRNESFYLKDQVAQPLGRHDFWKDVERLEAIVSNGDANYGAAIFVTNDSAYWSSPRSAQDTSAEFSLSEGRTVTGELNWSVATGEVMKKKRASPIRLQGSYQVRWEK